MRREIIEAVHKATGHVLATDRQAEVLARAVLTAAVGTLPSDEIDEHVRLSATGVPVFIEWHDLLAQLTGEVTP